MAPYGPNVYLLIPLVSTPLPRDVPGQGRGLQGHVSQDYLWVKGNWKPQPDIEPKPFLPIPSPYDVTVDINVGPLDFIFFYNKNVVQSKIAWWIIFIIVCLKVRLCGGYSFTPRHRFNPSLWIMFNPVLYVSTLLSDSDVSAEDRWYIVYG